MKMKNDLEIDIPKFMRDYLPDESIWNNDNEDMTILKRAYNSLNEVDRIIMLLYMEYQSLSKLAKRLNISKSLAYNEIKRIKIIIYNWIKENYPSNIQLINRFKFIEENDN